MNKIINKEDWKKLRDLTGLSLCDCAKLLKEYDTIDNVLEYLRKDADVPDFVGTGKQQYEVFRNGKLEHTFSSAKEFDSFNPYPLWQISAEYKVRVLIGDGKYHWQHYK